MNKVVLSIFMLVTCLIFPFTAMAAETVYLDNSQLIISPNYPLSSDFVPDNLVSTKSFVVGNDVSLRADAAAALKIMLEDMQAAGIFDIYANSGYRSYALQANLHSNKINSYLSLGYSNEEAIIAASSVVLPPGTSEHQAGLAVDLSTSSIRYDLIEEFANTDAGIWLAENCADYGFILRYPQDKTAITGVIFEPWHFRYIGIPQAQYMQANDLCLEEYYARLRTEGMIILSEDQQSKHIAYYSNPEQAARLGGEQIAYSQLQYGGDEVVVIKAVPNQPLYDIVGHADEVAIRQLYSMGIVSEFKDGSFRPGKSVSRADAITLISRLPIIADYPLLKETHAPPFDDIEPNMYYYQPLLACYRAGIIESLLPTDDDLANFLPTQDLLRKEAALLLFALVDKHRVNMPTISSFKDVSFNNPDEYIAIEHLASMGVISTNSSGYFYPQDAITRAELSAMVYRILFHV